MSENVELVRRAVDAWNQRDPDLWRSFATADVVWRPAGPAAVEGTTYRGYEQVVSGLQSVWQTWDEVWFEESEVRDQGDDVLWLGELKLRGATSHIALEQEFAVRFEIRGAKIATIEAFLHTRDALKAVGLAE